jgi:hypothetical protein
MTSPKIKCSGVNVTRDGLCKDQVPQGCIVQGSSATGMYCNRDEKYMNQIVQGSSATGMDCSRIKCHRDLCNRDEKYRDKIFRD